jgi:hypothetical protein
MDGAIRGRRCASGGANAVSAEVGTVAPISCFEVGSRRSNYAQQTTPCDATVHRSVNWEVGKGLGALGRTGRAATVASGSSMARRNKKSSSSSLSLLAFFEVCSAQQTSHENRLSTSCSPGENAHDVLGRFASNLSQREKLLVQGGAYGTNFVEELVDPGERMMAGRSPGAASSVRMLQQRGSSRERKN